MTQVSAIKEHMEVLGSDGNFVGVVDRVEGDRIKLAKDHSPDGKHHFLGADMVRNVDEQVHLTMPAEQFKNSWNANDNAFQRIPGQSAEQKVADWQERRR